MLKTHYSFYNNLTQEQSKFQPDLIRKKRSKPVNLQVNPEFDEVVHQNNHSAMNHFHYEFIEKIGEGQYSEVFKVKCNKSHKTFACKVLKKAFLQDPIILERMRREAILGKELNHHNIIKVHEHYENADKFFIIMELLKGLTLKDHILLNSMETVEEKLGIIEQTLTAIKYCHKKGVIHRDIKPQNIFIKDTKEIVIIDFGVSKRFQLPDLTVADSTLGTPEYLAPEVFNGEYTDYRSDIYSLGIVFYEIFHNELPFQSFSIAEQYSKINSKYITFKDNMIPSWIKPIISKMLEPWVNERYQSIQVLLNDFKSKKCLFHWKVNHKFIKCPVCRSPIHKSVKLCLNCKADFNLHYHGDYILIIKNKSNYHLMKPIFEILFKNYPDIKKLPNQYVLLSHLDLKETVYLQNLLKRSGIDCEIDSLKFYNKFKNIFTELFLILLGYFLFTTLYFKPHNYTIDAVSFPIILAFIIFIFTFFLFRVSRLIKKHYAMMKSEEFIFHDISILKSIYELMKVNKLSQDSIKKINFVLSIYENTKEKSAKNRIEQLLMLYLQLCLSEDKAINRYKVLVKNDVNIYNNQDLKDVDSHLYRIRSHSIKVLELILLIPIEKLDSEAFLTQYKSHLLQNIIEETHSELEIINNIYKEEIYE